MAVIFAVVGGGAVIGIASSSSYDDYDDYDDYDNYSNYSDAAERRRRRIAEKETEISKHKEDVNSYKKNSVNSYLQSSSLKQTSGVSVSVSEVKKDGDKKIVDEVNANSDRDSAELRREINEINSVIDRIDKILEEGK